VPTIVGVGASAGGLEAFTQLLQALPSGDNLAFVLVQHLSPQHESALPALLAQRTNMRVVQVTDGQRVEARHVYVIPPNVHISIADGSLQLLPRPFDRTQYTPIDFFFQALALAQGGRAIGIILSGTASDGAGGVRAIKAAGGITIAQKPSTAKYDGMPRAAMATGMVDLVLTPQEIADRLVEVQAHPYIAQAPHWPAESVKVTDDHLAQIFALLKRISSVDFRQYKTPTVRRRLLRRMALHRLTDVNEYIRHLRDDRQELTAFYQDLFIHVTRFFRDPESFQVLSDAFPHLTVKGSADETVRIWVPGCATGEEAYSLAIVLYEFLQERSQNTRIQIFATDVSDGAIEHARTGMYEASASSRSTISSETRRFRDSI
jgi:two-component system CheB/CheR fusion protein